MVAYVRTGTIRLESTYPTFGHVTHPEQLVGWLSSARAAMARGLWLSDRPWERVPMDVPDSAFGPGSRRQFSDYFRGQSSVTARCIDDVTAWLATCEYATDLDQFNEPTCGRIRARSSGVNAATAKTSRCGPGGS